VRPHRHSTAAEFVRYNVENFGTPEGFTAKPEAYCRDMAGRWARGVQRSNYKARNARRVRLRAIGFDNAHAVTLAAMLEELSSLRDRWRVALRTADFYNSQAAAWLRRGDIEKASAYSERVRRELGKCDALDAERKALYLAAEKIAQRLPNDVYAMVLSLLATLEADALDHSSRCHRAENFTPAIKAPRTHSTFAHAPPAPHATFVSGSPGRGVAIIYSTIQESEKG
jgi:hypothetical protein